MTLRFDNGDVIGGLRVTGDGYFIVIDDADSVLSVRYREGTGWPTIKRNARRIFKIKGWKVKNEESLGTREVSRWVFGTKKDVRVWDVRFTFISGREP